MKTITVNIRMCHETTKSPAASRNDNRTYTDHRFDIQAETPQEAVGAAYNRLISGLTEKDLLYIPYTTFDFVVS